MAFYDYKCRKCETVFEIEKGMNETITDLHCPNCQSDNAFRLFKGIRQGRSASESFDEVATEQSGSCSKCSGGVCSSCSGH
jgi:putative FmdB family regulatory protein